MQGQHNDIVISHKALSSWENEPVNSKETNQFPASPLLSKIACLMTVTGHACAWYNPNFVSVWCLLMVLELFSTRTSAIIMMTMSTRCVSGPPPPPPTHTHTHTHTPHTPPPPPYRTYVYRAYVYRAIVTVVSVSQILTSEAIQFLYGFQCPIKSYQYIEADTKCPPFRRR